MPAVIESAVKNFRVMIFSSGDGLKLVSGFALLARQSLIVFVPILGPTLYLFFLVAVTLLHNAEELVVVTFRFEEIIVCEFSPFLLDFALELFPIPFELLLIHRVTPSYFL